MQTSMERKRVTERGRTMARMDQDGRNNGYSDATSSAAML